jgi:predicted flap endonuclease-1-like 5' DNA nuclease
MPELTILVRVIVPGVYNGLGHKSLPYAEAGDLIHVAGGGYGESLIADGYVTDDLARGVLETEAEAEVMEELGGSLDSHAVLTEVAAVDRLAEIKGVGVATAKKLVALGVTSVAAFVEADTAVLAEGLNTTDKRVQGWQEAATALLEQVQEEGA